MSSTVWAPGKAMLIGEYAVLDGAKAVVAAVDCYAIATLALPTQVAAQRSPFVATALVEARSELERLGQTVLDCVPIIDTSAFQRGGKKLGLGSSAAATVACVGALFAAAGLDLDDTAVRAALHRAARRAHDGAQGTAGSGADVLAATFGSLQVLHDAASTGPDAMLRLPPAIALRFIATTDSASTPALISRYRSAGAAVHAARERMSQAAARFIAACRKDEAGAVLAAVSEAESAFMALGAAMGCELVTAEHRAIAEAARRVGGVAKPSGAGGGDLAVVFLPDRAAAQALDALLLPLPLQISQRGVHLGSILEK